MKVTVVAEENHGNIGVTKDFPSAIDYLVEQGWIDEDSIYFGFDDPHLAHPKALRELFGEGWKEALKELPREKASWFFDGSFYFDEVEVFGA